MTSYQSCSKAVILEGGRVSSVRLHEVELSGTNDNLRPALHPEFATEVIDVPLDRVHAHDEVAGDLAVGGPFKQQE